MACLRGLRQFVKRLRKKSKILQFLFYTDSITTKKLNGMLNVLLLPPNCKNYVIDCTFVELRRSVPTTLGDCCVIIDENNKGRKKYEYNYIKTEQNKTRKKEITLSPTRGRTRTCSLPRTRYSRMPLFGCLVSALKFIRYRQTTWICISFVFPLLKQTKTGFETGKD